MTPNTNCSPSQSTQTAYLIKSSSSSEERCTSYLIKCHVMRYHGLRHRGLQSYSQLRLLHRVATSQSVFNLLFQSTQRCSPRSENAAYSEESVWVSFLFKTRSKTPSTLHFPTARGKCKSFFQSKAMLWHHELSQFKYSTLRLNNFLAGVSIHQINTMAAEMKAWS